MRYALLMWSSVASLSAFAAGCSCEAPATAALADAAVRRDAFRPDAPRGDAPRLDGGPTTEVCADRIRRVGVVLAPLPVPPSGVRLDGRPDHLLVTQSYGDEGGPHAVRLTVGGLDGVVAATYEGALPLAGNYSPVAVRGDGPYEVLFFKQDAPQFAIVELGEGVSASHLVGTEFPGAPIVTGAAPAARGGFVGLGVFGSASLVGVTEDEAILERIDLPPISVLESAVSDMTASGLVYLVHPGRDGWYGSVSRVDTTRTPFGFANVELETEPTISEPIAVSVSLVAGGVVAGFRATVPFLGVRFHWLGQDLGVGPESEIETGLFFSNPIGVTGSGPHVAALEVSGVGGAAEIRAGVAYEPGIIVGGARALVTNLDGFGGEMWAPSTGGTAIAYWRGGAPEIVTLCAPP